MIDGFQVKKTKNVKESVAYLTVMTRYLQSYYKVRTEFKNINMISVKKIRTEFTIQNICRAFCKIRKMCITVYKFRIC